VGPRLQLFPSDRDHSELAPVITETLRHAVLTEFRGYPTHFGPTREAGTRALQPTAGGPVDHKVEVTTVAAFLADRLGVSTWRNLDVLDWLLFSQQSLLEVTAGAVFHDGLGAPERLRDIYALDG